MPKEKLATDFTDFDRFSNVLIIKAVCLFLIFSLNIVLISHLNLLNEIKIGKQKTENRNQKSECLYTKP